MKTMDGILPISSVQYCPLNIDITLIPCVWLLADITLHYNITVSELNIDITLIPCVWLLADITLHYNITVSELKIVYEAGQPIITNSNITDCQ